MNQKYTKEVFGVPPLDNKKKVVRTDTKNRQYKRLNKRRQAKAITNATTKKLLGLNSEMHKEYLRAHLCQSCLLQNGNKVISPYCKSKVCRVCNRIRSAQMMQGYAEPLLALGDLYLVTLTTPNIVADELRSEIGIMQKAWRRILDNTRKRHDVKLVGLRKLECTYNYRADTYNPHYHILINSKEAAEALLRQWLVQFPSAKRKGQDVRKADDNALYELFKYITKDIVNGNYKTKAMDVMFSALRNKNSVYPFGGLKKVSEEIIDELNSMIITHKGYRIELWKWAIQHQDWISDKGELFVDCKLDRKTKNTLRIINKADEAETRISDDDIWEGIRRNHNTEAEILF